jgi:hypothetical protein
MGVRKDCRPVGARRAAVTLVRFAWLAGNERKDEPRRHRWAVVDRLRCVHGRRLRRNRAPRVWVAVKAWIAATGDLQPDAVPHSKEHAGRPEFDLDLHSSPMLIDSLLDYYEG